MAKNYTIAGQVAPVANTDTDLYTVPAGKAFVASTLVVTNRSSTDMRSIRVAVVPSGQTLDVRHFVEYDRLVQPNENFRMAWGMALPAGAKVVVRSNSNDTSYSLFGVLLDA